MLTCRHITLTSLIAIVVFPWLPTMAYEQVCGLFFTNKNLKLAGHVIKNVSVQTNMKCMDQCALEKRCYSINFYQNKSICELNGGDHLTNPLSLGQYLDDGVEYMNNHERIPYRCNRLLCTDWTRQCLVDKDGEGFKCNACEEAHGREVLWWPSRHVYRTVRWEKPFNNHLAAFTISLWLKVIYDQNKPSYHYTAFSYATVKNSNELGLLFMTDNTLFLLNGKLSTIPRSLTHNHWHHVAITWNNTNGDWQFFIDGLKIADGRSNEGHVIKPGYLVLGQEQDRYRGGFDPSQSFNGQLGNLHMWDKVLTNKNLVGLAKSGCGSIARVGNVIKWADVKRQRRHQVHFYCSYECQKP